MSNFFIKDASEYIRDINPIKNYIDQASIFLSKEKSITISEAKNIVIDIIKTNKTGNIKNPVVKYLERKNNGDKESLQISLSGYIKEIVSNNDVLAPSGTSYINPAIKKSILGEYTVFNIKRRSVLKKEALKAEISGDTERYISLNGVQGKIKINTNSLSGTFGSNGTSLFNMTGHSTLTSTTRAVSSLGNAITEKLIAGNRHYRNYASVLNNIVSIISITDLDALDIIIKKYKLSYPSSQDALECIEYSTRLYWNNRFYLLEISKILEKLSPIEIAAFIYIGDMYHLRKHNDTFVRQFLTELKSRHISIVSDRDKLVESITNTNEDLVNYVCQICSEEMKGLGKSFSNIETNTLQLLAGTLENVTAVLNEYSDMIQGIFASQVIPASVAYMPSMVRRTVVLSDTDSTMFSTDEYVNWYYGKMIFSPEAFSLAVTIMYIATRSIENGLRILSTNIGIEKSNISILSMKPEFSFPVFIQSTVAKHYFASISVKEGNIYTENKYEIKGVHLKSSAAPPEVMKLSRTWMESILDTIQSNEKISIIDSLTLVADLERTIISEIKDSKINFFRSGKIKLPEAYAGTIAITPYFHHLLWDYVFKPKYGAVEPLPSIIVKIPLYLPNKTACIKWIESIEDKDLSTRLKTILAKYNKDTLGTILIDRNFCISKGIPKEIIDIIDIKKIVLETTKSFRMVIESLGFCIKKDFLVSELGY